MKHLCVVLLFLFLAGCVQEPLSTFATTHTAETTQPPKQSPMVGSSPSPSGKSGTFELSTQQWGEVNGLAVQGDTVFLGIGPRVVAVNISDPMTPKPRGKSEVLPGIVNALVVHDDVAYVATGNVIAILDVHDPTHIIQFSTLELSGMPLRLLLHGNVLYAGGTLLTSSELFLRSGDHGGMLAAVDVSMSSKPQLLDNIEFPDPIDALAIVGHMLYANAFLIDVGNPSALGEPTDLPLDDRQGISSFTLFGNTLIVGKSPGLAEWDVTSPTAPQARNPRTVLLETGFPGNIETVVALDNTLYMFTQYDEDGMYDAQIVTAHLSVQLGEKSDYTVSTSMSLVGDIIVTADDGLKIYRTEDPAGWPVGELKTMLIQDVAVADNTGYIVNGGGHYLGSDSQLLSLILPSLDPIGAYTLNQEGYWLSLLRVTLFGDRAYLNAWGGGVHIVDVSDPTQLSPMNALTTINGLIIGEDAFGVWPEERPTVLGNRIIVPMSSTPGLIEINVGVPDKPTVHSANTEYIIFHVMAATDKIIYAVGPGNEHGNNLYLIDAVSDNLPLLGLTELSTPIFDIQPWGDQVLVATPNGLTIISVADPLHPAIIGERDLPGGAYAIAQIGSIALVTSLGDASQGRLYAIDLNNINRDPLDIFDLPIGYAQIAANEDWILVGNQQMGLYVIKLAIK